MSVQLFISCVSKEFGDYREPLRRLLTRDNVEVKVQEDFKDFGGVMLAKLDRYIGGCSAVVHIVGDMTGAAPPDVEVRALLAHHPDLPDRFAPLGAALRACEAISYTQWEAWLALAHGVDLLIVAPKPVAPRGPEYTHNDAMIAAQVSHLQRLEAAGRHCGFEFADQNDLCSHVAVTIVLDILVAASAEARPRQPRNLPYASLGELFVGRDAFLAKLHGALNHAGKAAVTGRALHGLGGVGKTRLAVEYAHRHADDYRALMFVSADTPQKLQSGLAALAGGDVLDLKEKEQREDEKKVAAVLKWLDDHPGWLLILDNIDYAGARDAATALVAKLKGGAALVAGRFADFPAELPALPLDVLDEADAAHFLLARTDGARIKAPDDAARALELGCELGRLALGLEQAGAYIAAERIGFARYLKLWREKRATVLTWFDKTLMSYDHDTGLAATWTTSVDRLTPDGRRLIERLAFLAPEPVPDSLLDVAAPGDPEEFNAGAARANLFAYSLVSRAAAEAGKAAQDGFAVHRLVQDFTRRAMSEARREGALRQALGWVNRAFAGDPQDVRSWPVLDPLAPHALAVAKRSDEAAIAEPTAWLFNQLAVLLNEKARHAEAEPLFRRALSVDEASTGPDHPNVATSLNNLAGLLRDTNRVSEAEPLFRRALAIDQASKGPDHPDVARDLNNLAEVLRATNRLSEAEPLYRRALAIFEASYGSDYPDVATGLNNLALLLKDTNRLGEAEPLYRRALAIDEASYGPDHPKVAIRLNNLASLLQATKRLGEAEPLYRRALAIDEASYGPDHPSVATGLNNLAGLLYATNRLGESEPLCRRALAILEASFGPDHPHTATTRANLAALEASRG
ncbi:MAG: tetratricopeptide repeat protein [Roseiarcus sp.]|jgi:tetratricopeptide (TPR) repeat protein